MKTFKSSVRLWFAALFISAGVLCAIWTLPISTAREKITFVQGYSNCCKWCDSNNKTDKSRNDCYGNCYAYWTKNGSDEPTLSPTSQRHPFGPPRKFGPSPSPTAMPILLAKPAKPTPSPKPTPTPKPTPKDNSHSHHSG
jgi:hypothetical protein